MYELLGPSRSSVVVDNLGPWITDSQGNNGRRAAPISLALDLKMGTDGRLEFTRIAGNTIFCDPKLPLPLGLKSVFSDL